MADAPYRIGNTLADPIFTPVNPLGPTAPSEPRRERCPLCGYKFVDSYITVEPAPVPQVMPLPPPRNRHERRAHAKSHRSG